MRWFQPECAGRIFPRPSPKSQPAFQIIHSADAGKCVTRFRELQHFRAPEQRFLRLENIARNLGAQGVPSHQGLRKSTLGCLFGEPAQAFHYCIKPLRVQFPLQGVVFRDSHHNFVNDLAQATPVGEGQGEKFH